MSFGLQNIRHRALRQWVASLLTVLFVARALIPVGYMPDFSAATKGVFKVVICSAMGAKTISLDAAGKPAPNQQYDHHDQPCAFSGMATVALPEMNVIPLSAPVFEVSPLIAHLAVQLPPTRAGPQLGSRGPPQLS